MAIERVVTSGTFSIDGEDFEVDNNVWLVGDDDEVLVIDAAHDHRPILEAVRGRGVVGIVATHGHNDHINAAVELADAVDGPILMHPDDTMLWDVVHPGRPVDGSLADGQELTVGRATLRVLHTPGHSPGGHVRRRLGHRLLGLAQGQVRLPRQPGAQIHLQPGPVPGRRAGGAAGLSDQRAVHHRAGRRLRMK